MTNTTWKMVEKIWILTKNIFGESLTKYAPGGHEKTIINRKSREPFFKYGSLRLNDLRFDKTAYLSEFQTKTSEQVRNVAKIISYSRQYFSLFSLYFELWKLFQKWLCTLLWQITVFWRLSTTNSNTLIPAAENSHEVKTDLRLRRPEILRLPAGFRKT